ncbi:MAG: class I SAM-dependent methyltransferase [Methanospirillum sp.]
MNDIERARRALEGPREMAEGIALQRYAESNLPADERIFFDPLAVHFIDPRKIAWARDHPAETRAMVEELERTTPGWSNSIRARVRYFDDAAERAARDGVHQMVVLGAGYDTRAYRIDAVKDSVRVFEVDRPAILERKADVLTRVLGATPDHVTAVPLDLEHEDPWDGMARAGFTADLSTLFVLEGLVMYLPRDAVERLFDGIARHAPADSSLLFDCVPHSLADGTLEKEGARNILAYTVERGEPILSGFADGEVEPFLARLGFSGVTVVSSSEYGRMYYHGKNAGRRVSSLLTFVRAEV